MYLYIVDELFVLQVESHEFANVCGDNDRSIFGTPNCFGKDQVVRCGNLAKLLLLASSKHFIRIEEPDVGLLFILVETHYMLVTVGE